MPVLVVLIIVGFVGFIYYQKSKPNPLLAMSNHQFLDECTTDMATQFHIHSHLTILNQGQSLAIPAQIGITDTCMSSLHTHDGSGVIHIEAPMKRDFLLSDFFYNWKKPYSKDQVMDMKADANHAFKFYVDGREVADPDQIILADHQDLVIDYYDTTKGPDPVPALYTWPDGSQSENDANKPLA